MELVDSHVHLDDEAFGDDLEAVIARAREAGVRTMVAIGTTVVSSHRVVALAERHPDVVASVGIHPHEAGRTAPDAVGHLAALTRHPRVVAVGETGLDHYRDYAPPAAQAVLFRAHLEVARAARLPVVIHCREAYPDVLGILAEFPDVTAVMHTFSGSAEIARQCLAGGHYLSFAGPVTYLGARRPVEVAREVPVDRLLVETDAPYLTPHPHRGRRNEPAFVRLVVARLAEIRGEAAETIAAATTANARRIFGLRPAGVEA